MSVTRRKFFGMLGAVAASLSIPIPTAIMPKYLRESFGPAPFVRGNQWSCLDQRIFFQILKGEANAELLPVVPKSMVEYRGTKL